MRKGHWDEKETTLLREVYNKSDYHALQNYFPYRTLNSIHTKARLLGLPNRFWSTDEVELLEELYPTIDNPTELVNHFPKRTLEAILKKANLIGLNRPQTWTDEEIDRLKIAYLTLDTKELYQSFPNRKKYSIFAMALKLNLERPSDKKVKMIYGRPDPFLSNLSEFELGYLSGLIDGEGHIGISKDKHDCFRLRLSIANTDKAMIDWLFDKIPNAMAHIGNQKHLKNKTVYHWVISGNRRVQQFLSEIKDYLIVKHSIAQKLSEWYTFETDEEKEDALRFVKNFNKMGR